MRPRPRQPLSLRFWDKVERNEDGCWLWRASTDPRGYGKIVVHVDGEARLSGAHRVSWELANGPIPTGLCVLHRCDTPSCVRPDHLFLGTLADNTKDMYGKGRHGNEIRKAVEKASAIARARTECVNGHPYSGDNVRIDTNGIWRVCRTCKRESLRRRRAVARQAAHSVGAR